MPAIALPSTSRSDRGCTSTVRSPSAIRPGDVSRVVQVRRQASSASRRLDQRAGGCVVAGSSPDGELAELAVSLSTGREMLRLTTNASRQITSRINAVCQATRERLGVDRRVDVVDVDARADDPAPGREAGHEGQLGDRLA